ncbi:MAG TPA: SDR family NAD(P)-dependent oxidoreductase, partial [Gammaproteobacteria bacterium]|nr:SDR family NAD(P)-dependent oxidoreductase [Gammaproteobacteria bacterium]
MGRLEQKVAIVTGAARGIGAAIARAFAAEGAFVYVTDVDDAPGDRVALSLGARAAYRHLDVREETDWRRVTDAALAERGRLDVVVNNAGITGLEAGAAHDPEHASLEDWRAVHRTNLDGVFLG